MNRSILCAFFAGVAFLPAFAGEDESVVFTKHVRDDLVVRVEKTTEIVAGKQGPLVAYTGRAYLNAAGEIVADEKFEPKGTAWAFTVFGDDFVTGERAMIRKYLYFDLNWKMPGGCHAAEFYPPNFAVLDAAAVGDSVWILEFRFSHLTVERVTKDKPGGKEYSKVVCWRFPRLDVERFFLPITSGTIVPVPGGAYVFLVSKYGKRTLWQVKDGEFGAKQVWCADDGPAKAEGGGAEKKPPVAPARR